MWQVMSSVGGRDLRSSSDNAANMAAARSGEQRQANASGVVLRSSAFSSPSCLRTFLEARGIMVEILPDSTVGAVGMSSCSSLSSSSRKILGSLGFSHAELRKTTPLRFACRCSPDRAVAMLAALSDEERAALPPSIDITCHMCGKTFTVKV